MDARVAGRDRAVCYDPAHHHDQLRRPCACLARRPREPPMISTGDLRKGVVIELDGDLWQILDYHHIKIGRGSAQVRIKLTQRQEGRRRSSVSFQAGDRWPRAQLDRRPIQFLYRDGDDFHFMETETYEQFSLDRGPARRRRQLPQGRHAARPDQLRGRDHRRRAAGHGRPRRRRDGARASPATRRPARASPPPPRSGLVVQVPLFVNEGDTIRVDTRTGEYQTRL